VITGGVATEGAPGLGGQLRGAGYTPHGREFGQDSAPATMDFGQSTDHQEDEHSSVQSPARRRHCCPALAQTCGQAPVTLTWMLGRRARGERAARRPPGTTPRAHLPALPAEHAGANRRPAVSSSLAHALPVASARLTQIGKIGTVGPPLEALKTRTHAADRITGRSAQAQTLRRAPQPRQSVLRQHRRC
jgi:hypothetical protein